MGVYKDFRIWYLKRKARRYLENYRYQYDDMNCGAALGAFIRGGINWAKLFNATLDQLAEIDPECPTKRLPE